MAEENTEVENMDNNQYQRYLIRTEVNHLKKEIKKLKYLIVFILVIITILTLLLIGEYTMIWGGAFIEDPNNLGFPLTRILFQIKINKEVKIK